MRASVLCLWSLLACGGPVERMPSPLGAQMIFTQSQTCPADRVSVTPRPDLPPHTILARHHGEPPPEIAADPARMQLWLDRHGENLALIDSTWKTFELRGCDVQALYVCQHPTLEDFSARDGTIVGDATSVRDGKVLSAVRCTTNVKRQLEMQSGAMGDIDARMNDPNVPVLPAHTPLSALPPALQKLRVFNAQAPRPGVMGAVCHGLGQRLDASFGWTPVEAGQPADILLTLECFTAANVTHDGRMFVLLPLDRKMSASVSTPDGNPLVELPPFPATFACPTADAQACSAALDEYATATTANAIAQSPKVIEYLAKRAR